MRQKHLAAAAMLACACLTAQAAAADADLDHSFEDRLHEVWEHESGPGWRIDADLLGGGTSQQRAEPGPPLALHALFSQHPLVDRRKDWGDPLVWYRDIADSRKDWGDPIKQGIFGRGFGYHGRGWIEPNCIPAVPEPSGLALMAGGLMAVAMMRRRRR